jgi:YVTN family beta-propeller protein
MEDGAWGQAPRDGNDGGEDATEIRTFLIADVRGYTLFTHERGDETAAKLAAKFAMLSRASVEARGGSVIELRGDEALAVFGSPRQAIRAAIELQRRFVEETASDPSLPLPVGIGLDAGEAVQVEGGYRGGALNLAARLCGQAGPGEILASQEVTHLARRIEGVIYVDGGELSLKGLKEPVHVVRVVPEEDDPAKRFAVLQPEPAPTPAEPAHGPPGKRRLTGRSLAVAGLAVLVIAAIGIPVAVHHLGGGLPAVDANAAGTIDPASGHITGQVALGDIPSGIASGAGSVWIALEASGSVARVDPQSDTVVQRIPVGSDPAGVAFGGDAVWVTNSDSRTVSRIDPASNTAVQTIIVGNAPSAIAFGEGFVWVTNTLDGTVSKIDPVSGKVKATIAAGANPVGVAVGAGSVWVANQASGQVARIDPATGTVGQTVSVGHGPSGMTFDGNDVWVANSQDGTVSRIDPATGDVSAAVPVGGFPGEIAAGGGAVWAADAGQDTVTKIDPGSRTVTGTTHVTNAPQALAFADGVLWVTTRGSATSHQGGTLTVVTSGEPGVAVGEPGAGIDPNASYDVLTYGVLTNTNDGLLTYARVGGTAGSALVPDLAETIPAPTDGGTTYTFRLRRGILYSDGTTVKPKDVLTSFERAFTIGAGAAYHLASLVGAERCSTAGCDLRKAIVTDNAAGTVTFHLKAPDPEFLDVLGMPFLAIVPSSAPSHNTGTHPLPATGPYMIASYTKNKEVDLIRNPNFHQWSPAAQPAGYANRIIFRFGVDIEQATSEVERGQADLLLDEPPTDRLQEIQTRFSAQSHPYTNIALYYMFLNTQLPPFDHLGVRRALNYAVNRAKMASALPATGAGRGGPTTCQALPPNLPGYSPYCPYTLAPAPDGRWTAPDLARAKRLVAASGTKRTRVTVWSVTAFARGARYVASVLRKLHYRVAAVKLIADPTRYFRLTDDSSTRAQIGIHAWFADVPAPSDFIATLLTCARPNDPSNKNASQFCDTRLDRQIRAAQALQATDPPRANTLWAKIDRRVVDQAPWVPFTTPVSTYLVSTRVGNYQYNPVLGVLVGQLWVS